MNSHETFIKNDFQNSSFWKSNIKDDVDTDDYAFKLNSLVKYKNAIANFVSILTKKNIPVRYHTIDGGYTDGITITISSHINAKNFDSVVGLALHEGSHIVLSDFSLFKELSDILNDHTRSGNNSNIDKILKTIHEHDKVDVKQAVSTLRCLLNYIEDRRIDKYIQTSCPGYVGYYESLYFRYFNNPAVSETLQSDEYRDETVDSYMCRIINFTNSKSDLKALLKLNEIYNTINIKNIDRLKNSNDSLKVAGQILKILMDNIDNFSEPSKSSPLPGDDTDQTNEIELDENDIDRLFENDYKDFNKSGKSKSVRVKLTPEAMKKFNELLKKQKDFLDGKVSKSKMTLADSNKIDSLSNLQATVANVNEHSDTCIIIDNITADKFYSDDFLFSDHYRFKYHQSAVNEGIRLGNILKNKLKIRNEETTVQYLNKELGRINKRQLYSAGFNTSFFKQSVIEKYGKCILHISIDMSGSMSGKKLSQVITCTVAIAKAIEYIENIELQISLRASSMFDNILAIIYDTTKRDSFNKIKTLFPDLADHGGTPEGLCYEALLKYLKTGSKDMQSIFINFSDGEPTYKNGIEHTRSMVKKMNDKQIETISYFIYEVHKHSLDNFKRMYGNSACDIDVTNVTSIAKTINEKLLLK